MFCQSCWIKFTSTWMTLLQLANFPKLLRLFTSMSQTLISEFIVKASTRWFRGHSCIFYWTISNTGSVIFISKRITLVLLIISCCSSLWRWVIILIIVIHVSLLWPLIGCRFINWSHRWFFALGFVFLFGWWFNRYLLALANPAFAVSILLVWIRVRAPLWVISEISGRLRWLTWARFENATIVLVMTACVIIWLSIYCVSLDGGLRVVCTWGFRHMIEVGWIWLLPLGIRNACWWWSCTTNCIDRALHFFFAWTKSFFQKL